MDLIYASSSQYQQDEPIEPPATVYDRLTLPRLSDRPYTAVNMVSTVDGRVTMGQKDVGEDLGGRLDRDIMYRLRVHFDAVLRGAGTVRSAPYYPRVPQELEEVRVSQGKTPQPRAVVITGSCDLPLDREYFTYDRAPAPVLVLTGRQAPPENIEAVREVACVRFAGEKTVDISEAVRILKEEFEVDSLLSEGGPNLNWWFLHKGCLDELFWTIAPQISGFDRDYSLVRGRELLMPVPNLRLITAYHHENELFLRYTVETDS